MNSREQSDMPPTPSYPSPNGAQMAQGAMPSYYGNRQLTTEELLSGELSREASGPGLGDGSSNGVHHGQSMVLGSSNAGDMGRPSSEDQHAHFQFTPSQQVGVDPNHDLSYGEQSARKRSKISRACDECRRKKVRCDATSENGLETCSNCRRLGVVCQFSRVPMKRGPSKGYIKELAERLHTLESQMQPGMVQPDVPYQGMSEVSLGRGYQDFTSPVDSGSANRKRTYSVFEGLPSSSFAQPSFNTRGSQNTFDGPDATADPYNPTVASGAAPKPGNLFWNPTEGDSDLPTGLEMTELPRHEGDDDMTPVSLDEGALEAYYQKVHTLLPILPHTRERTLELLHQCHREAQEIFCYALYAVTRTDLSRVASNFERVTSFGHAQDLLLFHTRQPLLVHTMPVNTIWLQSLILMIIDCDARGPDNLVGNDSAPKHTLVSAASKLGYDLAKIQGQLKNNRSSDPDVDSEANLVRRIYVSLTILTRWYAISVADATVLGGQEIGGREDEKVVGQITTGIASYSTFLSEMVTLATVEPNVCQTNTGLGRMVGANLVASLERLADMEDIFKIHELPENTTTRPLFESLQAQLYWTLRLLIKRHVYVYSPYEIIYCAQEVINELHKANIQSRLPTPFDLHSLALASMTLLEATVLPEHENECWSSLQKVEEILDRREKRTAKATEFDNIFGTPGWDAKIRVFLEWRRIKSQESQLQESIGVLPKSSSGPGSGSQPPMGPNEQRSLQHLADLAVGAEGSVSQNAPTTPPPGLSADQGETSPNLAPQLAQSQGGNGTGRVVVDFTMLTREGYLNVFSGLIYRRNR
ncbi:hypothetical protein N7532_008662 [Penicillium argentinense]|uniref:Zn(2)-C6 fungal-type domain-containing protein n=1 Tax=Penicillium argentinense TaxID=1131581 RepID=A0A9W9EXS4_9EURO|nr:uncharacterized protein N7532_008662 [Penicillium argentinense]KAJ5089978.1 hypothetical protein N7532_008662 [Penicillium argentinense]